MRATYSLEIRIPEIESDNIEKLTDVTDMIEIVIRGILQECDLEAVSRYNGYTAKLTEVKE